jgi:hypothetical protein
MQALPGTHERASLTLRASMVEVRSARGVELTGSDAIIEGTIVRGVPPFPDDFDRAGIAMFGDAMGGRAKLTLRTSLLDQNPAHGLCWHADRRASSRARW